MNDIELCYGCANDGSTLNNMQTIIIPPLLKRVEEAKMVIRSIPNDKRAVADFRFNIVQSRKAIRHFYSRFPDLPPVKLSEKVMQECNFNERPPKEPYAVPQEKKDALVKILSCSREIFEYGEVLRGLKIKENPQAVKKAIDRIIELHKVIKEVNI